MISNQGPNKCAEAEIEQRNQELLALQSATAVVCSSLDLQHVLETLAREMANLLGVESCAFSDWDRSRDVLLPIAEYPPGIWRGDEPQPEVYHLAEYPTTRRVLVKREPVQMTISQPDIDPAELAYMKKAKIQTFIMIPLVFQDNAIGLLELEDGRFERTFAEREIALAQALANQAAGAVQNARLYQQAQQEIAERKRAEDALRESEEKYRTVVEQSLQGIMIVQNLPPRVVFANPTCAEITGYTLEELLSLTPEGGLALVHPEDLPVLLQRLQEHLNGSPVPPSGEFRVVRKDGKTRCVEYFASLIELDDKPAVQAAFVDITERKRAEEQLRASLREKETLLQEIHHRVKNNLQVISSLLRLQAGRVRDQQTLDILTQSRDRVKSMALVHETLYQSKDLAQVDFGRYVRSLTGYLVRAYRSSAGRVALTCDVRDVALGIDTAISCGLIINELVSNALKYAFPNGREGEITVQMRANQSAYTLQVRDDGVGLPAGLDWRNSASLGLQLVTMLAEQIEGDVQLDGSAGTAFRITFGA